MANYLVRNQLGILVARFEEFEARDLLVLLPAVMDEAIHRGRLVAARGNYLTVEREETT